MKKLAYTMLLLLFIACGGGGGSGAEVERISVNGLGFYDGETLLEVALFEEMRPLPGKKVSIKDLSGKIYPSSFQGTTAANGRLIVSLSALASGPDNGTFEITAGDQILLAEYFIYASGVPAPTNRVYFERNGGSYVSTMQVHYGSLLVEPPTPIRQGFTFMGWYRDETLSIPWHFELDRVYAIIRLYAKWEAHS